jgi:hypothetical protein
MRLKHQKKTKQNQSTTQVTLLIQQFLDRPMVDFLFGCRTRF